MSPGQLNAYLTRIGFVGAARPDLETLRAVLRAHVETIPFENVDVVLGRPVDLSLDSLHSKLVQARRGGYCFEHNALLGAALEAIGVEVAYLAARARVGRAREQTPPRTHLVLRARVEGVDWLVDAGLGGLTPTAPLRWGSGVVQATPHEPRRLLLERGRWFHQARLADGWVDVCEVFEQAMPPIDREVASWFTSTHPDSDFRRRLMVARATPDGRITLSDRRLTVRTGAGLERTVLETPRELEAALRARFGIDLASGPAWPAWLFEAPAG